MGDFFREVSVAHAFGPGCLADGVADLATLRRVSHRLGIVFRLLRQAGLRHQDVEIMRRGGQRFVPVVERLREVSVGSVDLGELPVPVGHGLRVGGVFLIELLIHGQLLLWILFARDGLERMIFVRARRDHDAIHLGTCLRN